MSTMSLSAVPLDVLKPAITAPATAAGASEVKTRAAIAKASQSFESQFLSSMLGQMFEGIDTDGPFGGGAGEQMFRSVMMDAFGKQIAKAGGVGVGFIRSSGMLCSDSVFIKAPGCRLAGRRPP